MKRLYQYGDGKSPYTYLCFKDYEAEALRKAGAPRVIRIDSVDYDTLQTLANNKGLEDFYMWYNDTEDEIEKVKEIRAHIEGAHKGLLAVKALVIENSTKPYGLNDETLKELVGNFNDTANDLAEGRAEERAEERRGHLREEYAGASAGAKIVDFLQGVTSGADTVYIPTGHKDLDKALNGGLYPCFYVIGGISSIGKTAFTMQIADQVAAAGNDVLIFSLEMSEGELMARSISRHTFERVKGTPAENKAKTEQQITTKAFYTKYDKEELTLIEDAARDYGEYAGRIHIFEGVGNISAGQIKQQILEHIDLTGNKPLVIIDYLQIIAPEDIRATDKQNTDKNVLEIKRLTRDLSLPVLAISSFNRESYAEPVTMASFKESGAIEYSSDCLIGLQYAGMDYEGGENKNRHLERVRDIIKDQNDNGKAGRAQHIQAKVLKNRKGYKENYIKFSYYPRYSYFENPAEADKDGFKPCANAGARMIKNSYAVPVQG